MQRTAPSPRHAAMIAEIAITHTVCQTRDLRIWFARCSETSADRSIVKEVPCEGTSEDIERWVVNAVCMANPPQRATVVAYSLRRSQRTKTATLTKIVRGFSDADQSEAGAGGVPGGARPMTPTPYFRGHPGKLRGARWRIRLKDGRCERRKRYGAPPGRQLTRFDRRLPNGSKRTPYVSGGN
jgi:hypothetical protein